MPVTNGPGTEAPAIEADPAAGKSLAGQRHPRPFRGILRDLLRPLRIWTGALQLWRALASLTLALSGLVAAVVIATLMVQGLTRHTVAVLPIAVPKELADKGFVPEVAASRLRDAMNAVAERSQAPKGPEIALRSDVPDIVVPTVGISIDSISRQFAASCTVTGGEPYPASSRSPMANSGCACGSTAGRSTAACRVEHWSGPTSCSSRRLHTFIMRSILRRSLIPVRVPRTMPPRH